jgi:hypothetical protein
MLDDLPYYKLSHPEAVTAREGCASLPKPDWRAAAAHVQQPGRAVAAQPECGEYRA